MEARQITERIEAVKERIAKREKTYQRHLNGIAKLEAKIQKEEDEQEKRFMEYDVAGKKEDAERCLRKISDDEALIQKYQEQRARQEEVETSYTNKVPDVLKDLENQLAEEWTAWDLQRRDSLFGKTKQTAAEFTLAYMSDEDIAKACRKEAKQMVIGLYERVYSKTGKVKSWAGIRANGLQLNGVVEGESGKVSVETVYAGGYNIQRLHIRTLVHEL